MNPLILTLQLDDASFRFFDAMRQRYFPPERNFISAHLTLFHHLPHTPEIVERVADTARSVHAPLLLAIAGLQKLGNGVAYRIECPELIALHRQLQQDWYVHLRLQDRQPLRPHVTVQNKVPPAEALSLYSNLADSFETFTASGTGLQLWEYLGGPWSKVGEWAFAL